MTCHWLVNYGSTCFDPKSHRPSEMQEYQVPEIKRTALHQLCLTVKAILPNKGQLEEILGSLLTPPDAAAVASAMKDLTQMGALDMDQNMERLTALGQHLASMPMHPRLGKALIYAAMLRFDSFIRYALRFYDYVWEAQWVRLMLQSLKKSHVSLEILNKWHWCCDFWKSVIFFLRWLTFDNNAATSRECRIL